MVGRYELKEADKTIGAVRVEKQGLYYLISCRCQISGREIRRLIVSCGGKAENLGILVPVAGGFALEKRIPCKRLGEGAPEFRLTGKRDKPQMKFAAVYPEEPFSYMARLKDAFLARQEGQLGIVFRE